MITWLSDSDRSKQNGVERDVFALATEVVSSSSEAEVSFLSPAGAVGVADDPVLEAFLVDAVANDQGRVGQFGPLQSLVLLSLEVSDIAHALAFIAVCA